MHVKPATALQSAQSPWLTCQAARSSSVIIHSSCPPAPLSRNVILRHLRQNLGKIACPAERPIPPTPALTPAPNPLPNLNLHLPPTLVLTSAQPFCRCLHQFSNSPLRAMDNGCVCYIIPRLSNDLDHEPLDPHAGGSFLPSHSGPSDRGDKPHGCAVCEN
jgi:hypothetical protein